MLCSRSTVHIAYLSQPLLGNIPKNVCVSHNFCEFFVRQFFPLAFKSEKLKRITGTEEREKGKTPQNTFTVAVNPIQSEIWAEGPLCGLCHMMYFICQFLLAGLDDIVLHLFSRQYLSCQIHLTVSHVDVKHAELLWVTVWHSLQPFLLIFLLVALRTFTLLQAHSSCSGNNFRILDSSFNYKWAKTQNAVKIK